MPMNSRFKHRQREEGLNTFFGMEYKQQPEEWKQLFDVQNSSKAFEEDVLMTGFGIAVNKAEGASVTYDQALEGWSARYNHNTVALAFSITEEDIEDNLYNAKGAKFSKALARSMQHTKEIKGAAVLNNGFNAGYAGGDGKALFAISGRGLANNNTEVRFLEAKNNYEAAKADYERKLALSQKQIVSEKELEASNANFENAKAIFDNLKNNFNVNGQVVITPHNGVVKNVFVKNGEYVEAGDRLFSLTHENKKIIKAEVQQKNYSLLSSNSSFNIKSANGKLYTQKDLNGMLLSFGKSIDEDQGYLIPVNFQIDGKKELLNGSFVDIYIKTQSNTDAVIVPNSSLVEEYGNYFVLVQLTPELFEKREVKVGLSDGMNSEIISGLNEEERIVSKGAIIVKLAAVSNSLDPHAGHVH